MRRLSDTIARLSALRSQGVNTGAMAGGRLQELRGFGTNPGELKAWFHVPHDAASMQGLVVVLHGCTQNAAGYDEGSGWSGLADELGFALLYPEQTRSNNFNLCFNWYDPGDSRRGEGEPLSIVQMIEHMVEAHQLDASRVFVTGLSAGGAMTSVMLATYPEVFASGAIIAGLPFGTAASIPQALERMRGHGGAATAALASAVLEASPRTDRRPSISIWHGTSDHVVSPTNADAILAQWQAVHGLLGSADSTEKVAGHDHRVWRDASGSVMIEDYRIAGMGHGTPLAATGPNACGKAGPHMLEVGLSSTRRIASFWGLDRQVQHGAARLPAAKASPSRVADHWPSTKATTPSRPKQNNGTPPASRSGVGEIIENALRAAALMK